MESDQDEIAGSATWKRSAINPRISVTTDGWFVTTFRFSPGSFFKSNNAGPFPGLHRANSAIAGAPSGDELPEQAASAPAAPTDDKNRRRLTGELGPLWFTSVID